jgi:sugar phosphate isomerase/epimerase
MVYQIGFFNRPWNQWDLTRAWEGIAASGARYVGLMRQQRQLPLRHDSSAVELAELSASLAQYDLQFLVALHSLPFDLPLTEAIAQARQVVDNIASMGGRYLLTTGTNDPDQYDRYYEIVAGCAEYAEGRGVMIVLKPHGGISATARDCLRAIQRVDSDNFRIWYDPGNVLYYTGTRPEDDVADIAEYVTGMCVKDCIGGDNPSVMVTPGHGDVDFSRVFAILAEAGYGGPCIVETLGGETPEEIDAAARETVGFLQETLGAL